VASLGRMGGPPRYVTPSRGDILQGVTPEGKENFCGQIYKEQWRNKVGQVKKVQGDTLQGGDTRVKSIKSDDQKRLLVF